MFSKKGRELSCLGDERRALHPRALFVLVPLLFCSFAVMVVFMELPHQRHVQQQQQQYTQLTPTQISVAPPAASPTVPSTMKLYVQRGEEE